MGNELVAAGRAQLPAHLQSFQGNAAFGSVGTSLAAHATTQGHPRISIKASRFRLQDVQGDEVVVPTHYLDVIIVDANPNKTKTFYLAAYNPAETEFKAPDCHSDNGISPAANSAAPQCGSCAACPHNVWGSKVTPSGAQTKACADSQRLAVIIADNPEGPVFELKVPAASISNLATYAKGLDQRGAPIPAVVTRIEFDPKSDYPKLTFKPIGWTTEAQAAAVSEVFGTEEVDVCTGKNEKVTPIAIAARPVATSAALHAPYGVPAPVAPIDPFAALGPAPVMGTPLSAAVSVAQPAPARRTRKKAEPAAELQVTQAPIPGITPAAQAVPLNTPVTNAALDDLISAALKV